jgi:hypothetical protein
MTSCRRSTPIGIISTALCVLGGIAVTLISCRNDAKEIVVIESRPMRGQSSTPCLLAPPSAVVEWDSELEFGCTGGVQCPPLAVAGSGRCAVKDERKQASEFEQTLATEGARDPNCNGIATVRSRALELGSSHSALQRPHWILKIAHTADENHAWLLVRSDGPVIGGYGQGTAPEIVHRVCTLVRQEARPEH